MVFDVTYFVLYARWHAYIVTYFIAQSAWPSGFMFWRASAGLKGTHFWNFSMATAFIEKLINH